MRTQGAFASDSHSTAIMHVTGKDPVTTKPRRKTDAATPLLAFVRALGTREAKEQFAKDCGTSIFYLYQLGAQEEPNPRLRLALAIKDNSAKLAERLHVPSVTLEDLLVGAQPAPPLQEPAPSSEFDGPTFADLVQ